MHKLKREQITIVVNSGNRTVCSKAVVLLLFTYCLLLLPLWESVIFLCFVVRYF